MRRRDSCSLKCVTKRFANTFGNDNAVQRLGRSVSLAMI